MPIRWGCRMVGQTILEQFGNRLPVVMMVNLRGGSESRPFGKWAISGLVDARKIAATYQQRPRLDMTNATTTATTEKPAAENAAPKLRQHTLHLEASIYARIEALAKADDRSINKMVNRLLADAIGRAESSMSRTGLGG